MKPQPFVPAGWADQAGEVAQRCQPLPPPSPQSHAALLDSASVTLKEDGHFMQGKRVQSIQQSLEHELQQSQKQCQ
eukprot:366345-Chlamydomonas_euryale.AAC.2